MTVPADFTISGNLVDIFARRIFPAEVHVRNGRIVSMSEIAGPVEGYLMPGFVDAHVHVESSMLLPSEFARLAVTHGTVATVSDPHEIANVLGVAGVEFMIANGKEVPFKFFFGAPSCVPATVFETAGARVTADEVGALLERDDVWYLSEVMDFPGVLHGSEEVMKKIAHAKRLGKPVDGHAPGLRGDDAAGYAAAGISTDHECFTLDEALDKLACGMHVQIREGSAARNFEALWPLLNEFPAQIMFCSDDKHPDDLVQGHINTLVSRAVAKGCDLFNTLHAACIHPIEHYNLPVGQLRVGDPADFVQVTDLRDFQVTATWINGQKVAENGQTLLPRLTTTAPNQFRASLKQPSDFQLFQQYYCPSLRVIRVYDGEIVTGEEVDSVSTIHDGQYMPDLGKDLLYIAVVNRYVHDSKPALGFVRGFGFTCGAIASSVAHDSHNIVAVGTSAEALTTAVNAVIAAKGGISATDGVGDTRMLALPIAGLMSQSDGWELAEVYATLDAWVKKTLGCGLRAPFMSLSFLALPVIPKLKMTDKGLFDVEKFDFVEVGI